MKAVLADRGLFMDGHSAEDEYDMPFGTVVEVVGFIHDHIWTAAIVVHEGRYREISLSFLDPVPEAVLWMDPPPQMSLK